MPTITGGKPGRTWSSAIMGDDQPPPIPPQNPESPSAPVPSARPSFMPRYESDPPTSDRPGLPTWMWVVIIVLLTIITLPLLGLGILYLLCLFDGGFNVK